MARHYVPIALNLLRLGGTVDMTGLATGPTPVAASNAEARSFTVSSLVAESAPGGLFAVCTAIFSTIFYRRLTL